MGMQPTTAYIAIASPVVIVALSGVSVAAPTAIAQSISPSDAAGSVSPAGTDLPIVQTPRANPPRLRPPTPQPELPTPQPLPTPPTIIPPPSRPSLPGGLEPGSVPGTIVVTRFEVVGSTIFGAADFAKITDPYTNRPITFAELMEAQAAITRFYTDQGYFTSGAVIPPQTLENGVVQVQIVEGEVEVIQVTGTRRLNPNYVRSRLAIGTQKPLNSKKLLEALQLLQLNPIIQTISAELSSGTSLGTNRLEVKVNEARTVDVQVELDNNRSPAVGSFRRSLKLGEANLLGQGDALQVGYANTTGSHVIDFSYAYPVNPRNGAISVDFQQSFSRIIEEPFDPLDIKANSFNMSLNYRQPIIETPTRFVSLGLGTYWRQSQTSILDIPFPLSPGSDANGITRVSTVRFFQDWVERSGESVFAARSEFNVGLGAFNSGLDTPPPNGYFVLWRGQAQWVKLLAPDALLILQSNVQFADRPVTPFDQFSIGGQGSVRGYRQDLLLADNGVSASAEVRLPVWRLPQNRGVLQVAPFVDVGHVWNSQQSAPDPNFLASVGIGLRWQQGNLLTVRLDWGIPLVSVDVSKDSWQEKGLTFSLIYNLF